MKTRRKRLTRGQVRKARAELALYRAWMDRIRLRDVANDLGGLEQKSVLRVGLIASHAATAGSAADAACWAVLERHERALAKQFAFLREKIGWVLQP